MTKIIFCKLTKGVTNLNYSCCQPISNPSTTLITDRGKVRIMVHSAAIACIRNLGVYQESTGSISSHVNHISKSCFFSLHRLSKIRSCLNQSTTEKLVHAFITSRLDYCNSILYGCQRTKLKNFRPFKIQQLV